MRQKILVVDDEPHILNFLKHYLSSEYAVYEARSATEAIILANRIKPDLILLDTGLPFTDGYSTSAKLKANPFTRNIPVLLMIARYNPAAKPLLAKSKADDIIAKPFEPEMLKRRMSRLLGGIKHEQTIIR
jgi:DNA-binding response OmpR family regulator